MSITNSFTKKQLREIYGAICVTEDTDITMLFATFALEDAVDICNDMSLEGTPAERVARGAFDANDLRQTALNYVETGLTSFVTEINDRINDIPVELTMNIVVSCKSKIG